MVTKRYEGQPATQTKRDSNRDKIFARSNHLTTWETRRRQDDVSGYKLQFLLSGVLPVVFKMSFTSYREDCLKCCPSTKVTKRYSKCFSSCMGGLHEVTSYATLYKEQRHRPMSKRFTKPSYSILPSNLGRLGLLSPTHGHQHFQQQSGQTTLQSVFTNKPEFLKATRHAEIWEIVVPRSMGVWP